MSYTTIIGICASLFTSFSLLPQLIKLLRERKSENLSLDMLGVLFTGLGLWVYYGILQEDWIIIIANALALVINLVTGVLAIFYSK